MGLSDNFVNPWSKDGRIVQESGVLNTGVLNTDVLGIDVLDNIGTSQDMTGISYFLIFTNPSEATFGHTFVQFSDGLLYDYGNYHEEVKENAILKPAGYGIMKKRWGTEAEEYIRYYTDKNDTKVFMLYSKGDFDIKLFKKYFDSLFEQGSILRRKQEIEVRYVNAYIVIVNNCAQLVYLALQESNFESLSFVNPFTITPPLSPHALGYVLETIANIENNQNKGGRNSIYEVTDQFIKK